MDGSEKLPLLVIGKNVKPRCFGNVKSLPVDYRANKKAWMTSVIFEEWLRKLDRKFLLQGRSILMVIDNCPAHPEVNGLAAIKLEFLPPNTTSHTQPCDQGIIHSFKRHYRGKVVKRYLTYVNDGLSAAKNFNISVLDALYNMRWAWDRVTKETVANCFRHAGFLDTSSANSDIDNIDTGLADDSQIESLIEKLDEKTNNTISAEEYISFDMELETTAEISVSEIVSSISDKKDIESDEDACNLVRPDEKVTTAEAKSALD